MTFFTTIVIWIVILIVLMKVMDYNQYDQKRNFWLSTGSLALMSSIGIMTLTVIITNVLNPKEDEYGQYTENWEELTIETRDNKDSVYFEKLKSDFLNIDLNVKFLAEHFAESPELRDDYKITEFYWNYTLADELSYKEIGYWGQGICYINSGSIEEGLESLAKVKNKNMRWYNYALAKVQISKNNNASAKKYFERELALGYKLNTYFALDYINFLINIEDYTTANKWIAQYNLESELESGILSKVFYESFNLISYYKLKLSNYFGHTNWYSVTAAILILVIWIIYLIWLDIFEKEKIKYIVLALLGGIVFCNLAIFLYDVYHYTLNFNLNGGFINDLVYCIFSIGLVEEFVKIIPLLCIIAFSKEADEPYDYLLFSGVSALGFAFIENILYFTQEQNFVSFTGRALYASVAHMIMSNIFAYGLARAKISKNGNFVIPFFKYWLIAAVFHGLYDFFIFHGNTILFYLGYLMSILIWMLLINNTLNNSKFFSYNIAVKTERVQFFLAVSLTIVFAFDYVVVSLRRGLEIGNVFLAESLLNYGMLIFFFTSKISTFDLVHRYWRNISIDKHDEDLSRMNKWNPALLVMRFFYINSVNPQNYVGKKIIIKPISSAYSPLFNDSKGNLKGEIIDRPILECTSSTGKQYQDPRWFLVRLQNALPTQSFEEYYLLVKFKDWQASLYKGKNNAIMALAIPSLTAFTKSPVDKSQFHNFGYAYISQE